MQTTPEIPLSWCMAPPTLHDISTVDGWAHYVEHRNDYKAPPLLTRNEYNCLTSNNQSLYDMARRIGIANLPHHDTPMGTTLTSHVTTTLKVNTANIAPGVRPGLFISANAGQGKSTLVREIAASFDAYQRQMAHYFPTLTGSRDRWIPVAWVNVPPKVTLAGLCRDILAFYGETVRSRAYEPELTARVRQVIADCNTRLLVLDDITRLKMHREADQNAADFIRSLMETAATVLGIGVDVDQSGLLNEGRAGTKGRHYLTQTRRRFTVHNLGAFSDETKDAFHGWLRHLVSIEEDLLLLDKTPGMLTSGDTPAYLLRRTGGVVGTLARLIAESSMHIIGTPTSGPGTGEYLSRALLDSVVLDHAAEHQDTGAPAQSPVTPKAAHARSRNGVFNGNRSRTNAA